MINDCRKRMSSTVNLAMTICGFVISVIFIIFVLIRLLCARLRSTISRRGVALGAAIDSIAQIDRGGNGMDPSVVALFPTLKFNPEVFASEEDAMCTVCLAEYEEREVLRIMPYCGHAFHVHCIDAWLTQQATCPVCRVYMQSSPMERNTSSALLSETARSRFSPGAIPESYFEQSLLYINSPASTVGKCSPPQVDAFNSFQDNGYGSEAGEHTQQMREMQWNMDNLDSFSQPGRFVRGGLESERIDDVPETAYDNYSLDTKSLPFRQERDFEQHRPRICSFRLGRIWDRGDPEVETSTAKIFEERHKGPIFEIDMNGSVGDIETGNAGSIVRVSNSLQIAEGIDGTGVGKGLSLPSGLDGAQSAKTQIVELACGESGNTRLEDKSVAVVDELGPRCLGDNGIQDRHSSSIWKSKNQEECMTESHKKTGVFCNELGWTPVTFNS